MASTGMAELEQMISKAKALGASDLGPRIASAAAPLVQEAVRKTAAGGQTPLGKAWQPKKKGGRPLVHAAEHIVAQARGALVAVVLTGVDVWHHRGTKGQPRRQVIPDGASVPQSVWDAVHKAARKVMAELGR